MPEHRKAPLQRTETLPIPPRFKRGGSSQGIKIVLFSHGCLEKNIPVVSFMVHGLKYFILINKQVPINCTLLWLKSRLQGMVFSCGCLAIMTLYIITDSINSCCERAPLISTELINCAAYRGSTSTDLSGSLWCYGLEMFDLSDTWLGPTGFSLQTGTVFLVRFIVGLFMSRRDF